MTRNRVRRWCSRTQRGASYITEFPLAIMVLLVVVAFPLLCLATITLRISLLSSIAKDLAHAASKAETFQTAQGGKPSACDIVKDLAPRLASNYPGITFVGDPSQLQPSIVILDSSDPNSQPDVRDPGVKLTDSDPIDTSRYVYMIRVDVPAQVDPLIKLNSDMLGNIPGLTTPIPITQEGMENFENAPGLKI